MFFFFILFLVSIRLLKSFFFVLLASSLSQNIELENVRNNLWKLKKMKFKKIHSKLSFLSFCFHVLDLVCVLWDDVVVVRVVPAIRYSWLHFSSIFSEKICFVFSFSFATKLQEILSFAWMALRMLHSLVAGGICVLTFERRRLVLNKTKIKHEAVAAKYFYCYLQKMAKSA